MEKKLKQISIRVSDYTIEKIEDYKRKFYRSNFIKLNTSDVIAIALETLITNYKV